MVSIPTGVWVDANVDAGELRKGLGASLVIPGGPVSPRPGRLAGPGSPLTVSPTTPASMAVLVRAGKAHTYRSAAYGPTLGIGPDGDVTIPIVAPSTGSQWFRVYLRQRDAAPPTNDPDSLAVVDVIAGNAAASPSKPALPDGALLLGEVLVSAGATSITASMVTDLPTWTAPRGGILPVANEAERLALATAGLVWPTLEVLELDTQRTWLHTGKGWTYTGGGTPPVTGLTLGYGFYPTNGAGAFIDGSGLKHLTGWLYNDTAFTPAGGEWLATTPAAMAPAFPRFFDIPVSVGHTVVQVNVETSGRITIARPLAVTIGVGAVWGLDHISYL